MTTSTCQGKDFLQYHCCKKMMTDDQNLFGIKRKSKEKLITFMIVILKIHQHYDCFVHIQLLIICILRIFMKRNRIYK